MKLNELAPAEGAKKNEMRVGRGIGSGKGKTCGRGQKGQKAREGVALGGFEGGQMPLYRRLPKSGFTNPFRKHHAEVTLGRLQAAVDAERLDPKNPIDEAALLAAGVVRRVRAGVRLIGGGELKAKLNLTLTGASGPAKAAVEAAGGSVTLLNKTPAPVKNPGREKRAVTTPPKGSASTQ
jgi:large subunit ribosomal protein L15